jgi:hypothetical protein
MDLASDTDNGTLDDRSEVEQALQTARALADQGRSFEAVDVLMDANRRHRDPEIERVLVLIRHAALDEAEPGPGLETWPREMPDPFPDVVGPPEVGLADLTGDVLGGAIVNHGCIVVRGLATRDEADALTRAIDRAFDACDARNSGTPLEQTAPWFVPFNPRPDYPLTVGERWWVREGGGVWTADSPRLMFDVLDLLERKGLRDILSDYLGERPGLSVKKCTLRRVPIDTGTDWHQDGAFLGPDIRTVNVWLTLTDCGVDAPGLDLVPKRLDLLETGTEGAQFDWSVGPGVVDRVSTDCGVVRPFFNAGDALLFDERNLHRTGVSPGMTIERYAIETWFFAPSRYPRPQVPIAF